MLATDSQADRIRRFREERLGRIVADETPVRLSSPHRLVLHMIPLASFLNRERLDLAGFQDPAHKFLPFYESLGDYRFNIEGHLVCYPEPVDGEGCLEYRQLFFDGTIEMVNSDILRPDNSTSVADGTGRIPSVLYEEDTIKAVKRCLNDYTALGIDGPIALSMAILGCRGFHMAVAQRRYLRKHHPIDRDVVIIPDIVIESLDIDVPKALKPIFDQVWNACGYPKSLYYDTDGNWNPNL